MRGGLVRVLVPRQNASNEDTPVLIPDNEQGTMAAYLQAIAHNRSQSRYIWRGPWVSTQEL